MFNDLFILAALAEEEVRALLNIAIPVRIFLNSEGSTSYEAIFKTTSLVSLFPFLLHFGRFLAELWRKETEYLLLKLYLDNLFI